MDFSKFKADTYDILALLIPGLLVICEGWVIWRGWHSFAISVSRLTGPQFTVLLFFAYAIGHIMQELSDTAIKLIRGNRFFKTSRDMLWKTPTAALVQRKIFDETGNDLKDVDVAFDYCLTRLQSQFPKREIFMANSDLARSLMFVSLFAMVPAALAIAALSEHQILWKVSMISAVIAASCLIAGLWWRRMVRFRRQADVTVFHAYLAITSEKAAAAKSGS